MNKNKMVFQDIPNEQEETSKNHFKRGQVAKRPRHNSNSRPRSNSPHQNRRSIPIAALINDEDIEVKRCAIDQCRVANIRNGSEAYQHFSDCDNLSQPFTTHRFPPIRSTLEDPNRVSSLNNLPPIQAKDHQVYRKLPNHHGNTTQVEVTPSANEELILPSSLQVFTRVPTQPEPVRSAIAPTVGLLDFNQHRFDENRNQPSSSTANLNGRRTKHFCSKCGQGFDQKGGLAQHDKAVHQKLKDCRCPHDNCYKSYATTGDLNRHIKSVHQHERPFVCICKKKYTRKVSLFRHIARKTCGPPAKDYD